MTCARKSKNLEICNCSYDPCPRKGACCECVAYHRVNKGLPSCLRDETEDVFGCGTDR